MTRFVLFVDPMLYFMMCSSFQETDVTDVNHFKIMSCLYYQGWMINILEWPHSVDLNIDSADIKMILWRVPFMHSQILNIYLHLP